MSNVLMFLLVLFGAVGFGSWLGYRLAQANARVDAMIREAREYHPSTWNQP